jgi:hypothetical protein
MPPPRRAGPIREPKSSTGFAASHPRPPNLEVMGGMCPRAGRRSRGPADPPPVVDADPVQQPAIPHGPEPEPSPEPSRLLINDWAEGKDARPDQGPRARGGGDTLTRLVLLNAISFTADWAVPLDATQTKEEDFHVPYKGKDLALVLVVPQDAAGLAAVEKQLTTAKLRAWLGKL